MPKLKNNPMPSHADPSVLSLFDGWAQTAGAAPAQTFAEHTDSYDDLACTAQALARSLRKLGVSAGDKVAVGVARSESLLPLLLAIWSLRAAYIPVDPTYPSSRRAYILKDAEAALLICGSPPTELDFAGTTVTLASLQAEAQLGKRQRLAHADYSPSDLAYIIYTSGSTGDPKGVAISQGNLSNFVLGMIERPGFSQSDKMLAVTTISFDIHVLELFVPLAVGAHVVVASKEDSVSQSALQTLLESHAITVMQATPATWRMLLAHGWLPPRPLKILVGGEALPKDLQPLLFAAASELWNMYGPTETTVWSLCHRILSPDEPIYIGLPIRGTFTSVVDEQLKPVAQGAQGELLIGGAGVALGYYKKAQLTQQRFLELRGTGRGRVYRTGDLVIEHEGGVIEYLSRIDNQLKVRGYRIEPLEVERVLEAFEGVRQAAVVASEFADNDRRLIAFYLGAHGDATALRDFCAAMLPAHMVPQHFLHLEQFPMTANNKIDRRRLAEMGANEVSGQAKQAAEAARDDLDRSLIAVWERALAVKGIGLDDNFFSLGGHSLLALQVAYEMNRATGLSFSATALFEAPTLRMLRDSAGDQAKNAASVVRLNAQLNGEPIFCLCGVQIYQDLADRFASERPVYGVFARDEIGFIEAQQQDGHLDYSFGRLVDSYMDAIRRQGDPRRFALVGLSFGGLIALEAAKRFYSSGVEVTSVILLDTYLSSSTYRSVPKLFADALCQVRQKGLGGLWQRLVARARKQKPVPVAGLETERDRAQAMRESAFDRAALVYEKQSNQYNFDVLLIKASYMNFGFGIEAKPDYGLASLVKGKLTVQTVDADHTGLARGAAVADVYDLIKAYEAKHP